MAAKNLLKFVAMLFGLDTKRFPSCTQKGEPPWLLEPFTEFNERHMSLGFSADSIRFYLSDHEVFQSAVLIPLFLIARSLRNS